MSDILDNDEEVLLLTFLSVSFDIDALSVLSVWIFLYVSFDFVSDFVVLHTCDVILRLFLFDVILLSLLTDEPMFEYIAPVIAFRKSELPLDTVLTISAVPADAPVLPNACIPVPAI